MDEEKREVLTKLRGAKEGWLYRGKNGGGRKKGERK